MNNICRFSGIGAAIVIAWAATSPSMSDNAVLTSPFQPHVDIKTFMEHVLNPAATVIWRVNGTVIDATGEHDLSPKSDDDWEQVLNVNLTSTFRLARAAVKGMMRRRFGRVIGITSVVVVGVSLNVGIPNTCMDLMNHGFEVIVPRDAVAGTPEEYGEQVIQHTLKVIATVTTSEAILEAWGQAARS